MQFKCNYTVLIQTIKFNISMQLVPFNPYRGHYQMLPFWARVDLGAMVVNGFSAFLQSFSNTETTPSACLFLYLGYTFGWGVLPL